MDDDLGELLTEAVGEIDDAPIDAIRRRVASRRRKRHVTWAVTAGAGVLALVLLTVNVLSLADGDSPGEPVGVAPADHSDLAGRYPVGESSPVWDSTFREGYRVQGDLVEIQSDGSSSFVELLLPDESEVRVALPDDLDARQLNVLPAARLLDPPAGYIAFTRAPAEAVAEASSVLGTTSDGSGVTREVLHREIHDEDQVERELTVWGDSTAGDGSDVRGADLPLATVRIEDWTVVWTGNVDSDALVYGRALLRDLAFRPGTVGPLIEAADGGDVTLDWGGAGLWLSSADASPVSPLQEFSVTVWPGCERFDAFLQAGGLTEAEAPDWATCTPSGYTVISESHRIHGSDARSAPVAGMEVQPN